MTGRELTRLLALILLVALALLTPTLALEATSPRHLPWWWQVPQLLGYAGAAALLVRTALTGRHPQAGARLLWAVTVVAAATAPVAMRAAALTGPAALTDGGVLPGQDTIPQLADVVPTAAGGCAIAWRGWSALLPAATLVLVHGLARMPLLDPLGTGLEDQDVMVLAEDGVFTLVLTMVCVVAIGAVRTSTEKVDSTRADASRTVASAELRLSRSLARTRWAAVVHDEVLAALGAVRADHPPSPEEREAAASAVAVVTTPAAEQSWTTAELADQIAGRAARTSAGAITTVRTRPGPVPSAVAEAVLAATAAAVRNVRLHAMTEGRCHVAVDAAPGRVHVEISDDGVGFAGPHVPAGRLGLRVAVRERMADVGGTARWTSAPFEGTTVELTWPAPDAGAADRAGRPTGETR